MSTPKPPPPAPVIAGDPRPLPPGWISEIDPSSGLPYFVVRWPLLERGEGNPPYLSKRVAFLPRGARSHRGASLARVQDTTQPNPQATWEDPRPAYYAQFANTNVHAPPPGPPPPPAYNPLNAPSPVPGNPNLGAVQPPQGTQYYPGQPIQPQQPQYVQQQQQQQQQPMQQPMQPQQPAAPMQEPQPTASSSKAKSGMPPSAALGTESPESGLTPPLLFNSGTGSICCPKKVRTQWWRAPRLDLAERCWAACWPTRSVGTAAGTELPLSLSRRRRRGGSPSWSRRRSTSGRREGCSAVRRGAEAWEDGEGGGELIQGHSGARCFVGVLL